MDKTYFLKIVENLEKINETQSENIKKAASLMADAIEQDRLINVYGGGGHTTLCMGEMFFRAGGLANINPIAENGLTVFNQALKYLELERTVNYGSAIMKYYKLQPGDLLIVFHNIGINPATIDAVMEAKKAGAKIVAISSSYWQNEHFCHYFVLLSFGKNRNIGGRAAMARALGPIALRPVLSGGLPFSVFLSVIIDQIS